MAEKTEKTLFVTVGLPRSGKSTWAKEQGYPIVNRDAIRIALHGQTYLQDAEDMVTAIETYMVKALFLAGHDAVIVDATHTKSKRLLRWRKGDWDLQPIPFYTGKEECIRRARKDGREDLIPVIERMAEESDFDKIRG